MKIDPSISVNNCTLLLKHQQPKKIFLLLVYKGPLKNNFQISWQNLSAKLQRY